MLRSQHLCVCSNIRREKNMRSVAAKYPGKVCAGVVWRGCNWSWVYRPEFRYVAVFGVGGCSISGSLVSL